MHIDVTPESLLVQFGYPANEALTAQMKKAISSTVNFNSFSKHILSLKDEIAHYDGYIALSNSQNLLKIKSDSTHKSTVEAYTEALKHWGEKYKVELEHVKDTNTYYIIGQH